MFTSELYAAGLDGAAPAAGAAPAFPWQMMVLIAGLFWFLLIRPNQKQQKQRKAMLSSLKEGDKVVTIGGIFATVNKAEGDDILVLKISENTNVRATRQSVEKLQS